MFVMFKIKLENIILKKIIDNINYENNQLKKKLIRSNTAKKGYLEEDLVCENLNKDNNLREIFIEFTKNGNMKFFKKLRSNFKTDISDNGEYRIQVKKFKNNQFGQLDRHWVDDLIVSIPNLESIKNILKNLCEIPLKNCGKLIDKEKNRLLLSNENYSKSELINFINILEKSKNEILNYIFKGIKNSPDYICGVEYIENKRNKLIIYKIADVIEYLNKFTFNINKSKSVISLGQCLSIQRKGGDSGKKSSNQIQFKLIFSKLRINNCISYQL